MDILEQLQRRAVEAQDLSRAHPRPWLRHLMTIARVAEALCERTKIASDDHRILRDVCLTTRLKPSAEERDFAFTTVEAELAMMVEPGSTEKVGR